MFKKKLEKLFLIIGISTGTTALFFHKFKNEINQYKLNLNEKINKLEEMHNQRINELERLHQEKMDHLNNIQESIFNNNNNNNTWSSELNSIKNQSFESQYSQYLEEINSKYLNLINELKQIFDLKLEKIFDELSNLYIKINNNTDLLLDLNKLTESKLDSTLGIQNLELSNLTSKFKDIENSFKIIEESSKGNEVFNNILLNEKLMEYANTVEKKLRLEDILSTNESFNKTLEELSLINQKLIDLFNTENLIQESNIQFSIDDNLINNNLEIFKIPSINEHSNILPLEIVEFIKNLLHIEQLTEFHIFCTLLLIASFITISCSMGLLYIQLSLKYRGLIWDKLPNWIKNLYDKLPKWYKNLLNKYPTYAKYSNYFNIFIILYIQLLNIALVLLYIIIGI